MRETQFQGRGKIVGLGFPTKVTMAFLNVAFKNDCVVMTRVPGAATKTLIDERYDLKGFYIKAKSCDWGPMAGFLCELPAFNKKGFKGIEGNRDANKSYVKKLEEAKGKLSDHDLRREGAGPSEAKIESPFVQIEVSKKRKDEVLAVFVDEGDQVPIGEDVFCVATDAARTILAEILLLRDRDSDRWRLYHGGVYGRADPSKPFEELEFEPAFDSGDGDALDQALVPSQVAQEREKLRQAHGAPATERGFEPIRGIVNPFPAYSKAAEKYKNTVTGDYDLFAVWPMREAALKETARQSFADYRNRDSDHNFVEDGGDTSAVSRLSNELFLFVPRSAFTLLLQGPIGRHEQALVDFVPDFDQIGPLEAEDTGNANNAVRQIAGDLNARAQAIYDSTTTGPEKSKHSTNLAFHSDEGGRPGIAELDLPVAVFLPRGDVVAEELRPGDEKDLANRIFVIERVEDFVDVLLGLVATCEVRLNSGWLTHVLTLANPKLGSAAAGSSSDKTKKYLEERLAEREKMLAEDRLSEMKAHLEEFLLANVEDEDKDAWFEQLVTCFTFFAPPEGDAHERMKKVLGLKISQKVG